MAESSTAVSGVSGRYANALFQLAHDAQSVAETEAALDKIQTLLAESADFAHLIHSPIFQASAQIQALSAILAKAGVKGVVAQLVGVLAQNRRLPALAGVVSAFKQMAAHSRGESSAHVLAAEPLTDSQVSTLKEALAASTGRKINLQVEVDPSLIGGLVLKTGSRMIDTSVKSKLNALKVSLKETG